MYSHASQYVVFASNFECISATDNTCGANIQLSPAYNPPHECAISPANFYMHSPAHRRSDRRLFVESAANQLAMPYLTECVTPADLILSVEGSLLVDLASSRAIFTAALQAFSCILCKM